MKTQKKALVCGAGGFIGSHLVKKLKKEGYWVRGVDLKYPEFSGQTGPFDGDADEFLLLDLRNKTECISALTHNQVFPSDFDEVYQLAANMGGMGFIHSAECEIMTDNMIINLNMISEANRLKVKRYFFSSSACVYRNQEIGEERLAEEDAYPALPDNEYGWEKLYTERALMTFARNNDIEVRIARFQNCFGPEGTWQGGREKAPAAICRKVASAEWSVEEGYEIDVYNVDVWGDGTAVRNFTYVDDMCDGIYKLTQSDLEGPTNIGTDELITVEELVTMVAKIAGKKVYINYIEGPVGVLGRYQKFDKIRELGWVPKVSIEDGLRKTYDWVEKQAESSIIAHD